MIWKRDMDEWYPNDKAVRAIHVMGPAHTGGVYLIRTVNEDTQETDVYTTTSQYYAQLEFGWRKDGVK